MAGTEMTPDAIRELIDEFYFRLEEFDADCYAMQTLVRELASETDDGIRRNWESKRPRYEGNLAQSADRLIAVTSALRLVAAQRQIAVPSLDALTLSLVYKPTRRYPATYPTESQVTAACDDCNKIAGMLHFSPQDEHRNVPEPPAKLNQRQMEIMKAALELGAVSAHTRVTGDEITAKAIHPQAMYNSHKVPFTLLRNLGYMDSVRIRGGGWFLTPKGIAVAEEIIKSEKQQERPKGP